MIGTSLAQTSIQSTWLQKIQRVAEQLLNGVAVFVVPILIGGTIAVVLFWHGGKPEPLEGIPLPMRVWENTVSSASLGRGAVLANLLATSPTNRMETRLSTKDFWLLVDATAPVSGNQELLDFPSRHLTKLACWDRDTDELLGSATRATAQGRMEKSRAGFALNLSGMKPISVLCNASFRGPANVTVLVSTLAVQKAAQAAYVRTSSMIEAGIGVLATFMLLTAIVNRSKLYWTFAGWLLLNMRMAAISAGTDFDVFGVDISPSLLIGLRQWTVCLYFAMTVAMFSLLFRKELDSIRSGWILIGLQMTAIGFILVCPFLTFETMLLLLWYGTALGVVIFLRYIYKILRTQHSRIAYWYAASIVFTLVASLSEVVAAATGQHVLLPGLNSVTAALASVLLASAALAERMRSDRLEKIEAQRTLRAAYEDSPIGLFTVSDGDVIIKANPVFQTMVQSLKADHTTHIWEIFDASVAQNLRSLGSSHSSVDLQTMVRSGSGGSPRWFSIKASTTDGVTIEGSLQDITERVLANERLEFLAYHDALTEALNLRGITLSVDRMERQPTALAYLDLERFKIINDLYGHNAGDNVLHQVCQRMQSVIGARDLLSRVGGDEFVIAFSDLDVQHAAEVCREVVALVADQPYTVGRQSFTLSVSIGLLGTERFRKSPLKDIISAADTLCRVAKKQGNERLAVAADGDKFFQHFNDELEVVSFLEHGEAPPGLFLVMQPEISLSKPFDSLNFEVLLRLRKADGGIVPANIIIEAAETHGKTAVIDRWVVTTAIAWLDTNLDSLRQTRFVGVNLSGGSLNDVSFVEELFQLFEKHPVALSMICLEITETVALIDMANMQRFIDRVRALGGKVALDDFGAGYSSFGYLKGLSVDALKLDGSLVKDATKSPSGLAIISAIGGLVSNLGMKSIGEYAENLDTIKALVDAGIDYAQGYAISKPVLPERILKCRSSADFIEDPDIRAYVEQLQLQFDANLQLFTDSDFLLH
jgi:diguanylate cyclase (GGDEF)-like protein